MKSYWTCRGCKTRHPRTKPKCPCGRTRPPKRVAKHKQVLTLYTYDQWVLWFGDQCNICGRPAGPRRNLDRDHDHRTGEPRGLLCHRCNRALPEWMTEEWMRKALAYLARPRPQVQGEVIAQSIEFPTLEEAQAMHAKAIVERTDATDPE